jgi:hypothetical protein
MPKSQSSVHSSLRTLAVALDSQFRLPGGFRFGLDGIIGLIPGIGSIITTFIAGYILIASHHLGAPWVVLLRMGVNIVADNFIGSIPGFGWILDFFYKSNLKNIALLESYLERPEPVRKQSFLLMAIFVLTLVFISTVLIIVGALLLYHLAGWILHAVNP